MENCKNVIQQQSIILNISFNVKKKFDSSMDLILLDYFKYIIKKHETVTGNPSITIYVNQTENSITFISILS